MYAFLFVLFFVDFMIEILLISVNFVFVGLLILVDS